MPKKEVALSQKIREMLLSMRDNLGIQLPEMSKKSGVPQTKISTFINGGTIHMDSVDKLFGIIPPSVSIKWHLKEMYEGMNPSQGEPPALVPQEILTQ